MGLLFDSMSEEGIAVAPVMAAKAVSARWSLRNCILTNGLLVGCFGCVRSRNY